MPGSPGLTTSTNRLVHNYKRHGHAIFRAVGTLLMARRLRSSSRRARLHRGSLGPGLKSECRPQHSFQLALPHRARLCSSESKGQITEEPGSDQAAAYAF
jgi:hypothetical protein